MFTYGSYDCIVSIVTRLQIGNMDFEFWQRQDMFHVLKTSRPALGSTQPPVQWVLETSSLGVRWLGHEANHSAPPSAKVKGVELYLHSSYMPFWQPRDNFASMGLYSQVHCTGQELSVYHNKKFITTITSNTKCNFWQLHFLNTKCIGYTATTQSPQPCLKIRPLRMKWLSGIHPVPYIPHQVFKLQNYFWIIKSVECAPIYSTSMKSRLWSL